MRDGLIGVTVLGATGSIGMSTLDVLARHAGEFQVVALTANRSVDRLFEQCLCFRPRYAVMSDPEAAERLSARFAQSEIAGQIEVLAGHEALETVAALDDVAYVMAAIVGAAGLLPTLAAARAGKRVLLANKEALVMSGALMMDEVRRGGAELLPIDSEHNAIFQCMPGDYRPGADQPEGDGVRRVLLTASGGPFRDTPLSELEGVTPEQACAHPNWEMGRKISVDSATMMNKGLEVIEACWLFDITPDDIQVVVHRQSVVHSMVEYVDGSVLAQMGNPDMRTPIAHALSWPKRMESGVASLDIFAVARLDFEAADFSRFPCLRLAFEAMRRGGTATAVLNAANEVAVEAFLDGRIGFTHIARVIEHTLDALEARPVDNLQTVLREDRAAREHARSFIGKGLA